MEMEMEMEKEMEWKKVSTSSGNRGGGRGEGLTIVGCAMTEEQLETLRHQISIYASICEQLVEMHKNITSHQDTIAGMRLGSIYGDPLMMSGGIAKITTRQRWCPTPMQLTILESIFDQGNGTPSKQKIKEMASELSQHGQISETNIYNWFQNRRARSKRKQSVSAAANASSTDTEAEAENECSKEVKGKLEKTDSFRSPGGSSTVHSVDAETKRTPDGAYGSNDSLKSLEDMDKMPFYEAGMLNPKFCCYGRDFNYVTEQSMFDFLSKNGCSTGVGIYKNYSPHDNSRVLVKWQGMNQSPGKFEMPEGLGSFRQGDRYNMFG